MVEQVPRSSLVDPDCHEQKTAPPSVLEGLVDSLDALFQYPRVHLYTRGQRLKFAKSL